MRSALLQVCGFVVWNLGYTFALLMLPPPAGLVLGLLVTGVYVGGVVLPFGKSRTARRRAVRLRLRPPARSTRRWLAAAVPVMLGLSAALETLYTRLVRVAPQVFDPFAANPFGGFNLNDTAGGRLTIAFAAIGVAPLVEELVFRGLLQRALEGRCGKQWGVAGAAALFGLAHGWISAFPLYFFLGLAFGFATLATRSVWAGVMLHAANNSFAYAFAAGSPATSTPGDSGDARIALVLLAGAAAAAFWVARGMWRAGHPSREIPLPVAG